MFGPTIPVIDLAVYRSFLVTNRTKNHTRRDASRTLARNRIDRPIFLYYCRREAHGLHADTAMSLEDIFGYISSKTGRIRIKLGGGMGNGERVVL